MGRRLKITDLPPPHLFGTELVDSKPFDMDAWTEYQERLPDNVRQALVEVRNYFASGKQHLPDSSLNQRIMENLRRNRNL